MLFTYLLIFWNHTLGFLFSSFVVELLFTVCCFHSLQCSHIFIYCLSILVTVFYHSKSPKKFVKFVFFLSFFFHFNFLIWTWSWVCMKLPINIGNVSLTVFFLTVLNFLERIQNQHMVLCFVCACRPAENTGTSVFKSVTLSPLTLSSYTDTIWFNQCQNTACGFIKYIMGDILAVVFNS